jgi:hypothetical protein
MIYNRNFIYKMMLKEYLELGVTENEYRREFKKLTDEDIAGLTGLRVLRKGFFTI